MLPSKNHPKIVLGSRRLSGPQKVNNKWGFQCGGCPWLAQSLDGFCKNPRKCLRSGKVKDQKKLQDQLERGIIILQLE